MKPSLFVFEGPDGVGKSTLASGLCQFLNEQGQVCELFSFPGRTPGTLGSLVYRLHHHPEEIGVSRISATAEQILFTAAHCDVIEHNVIPALESGRHVVLDRYWWSTIVYGRVGNLEKKVEKILLDLEFAVWREIKPTCIFFVRRRRPDFSEHSPEKWRKLTSLYEEIAAQESQIGKVVFVSNDGELKDSFEFLRASISAC